MWRKDGIKKEVRRKERERRDEKKGRETWNSGSEEEERKDAHMAVGSQGRKEEKMT